MSLQKFIFVIAVQSTRPPVWDIATQHFFAPTLSEAIDKYNADRWCARHRWVIVVKSADEGFDLEIIVNPSFSTSFF